MSQLLGRGPVAEVYAIGGCAMKVFPGRFDRRTLAAIERERGRLAEVPAPVLSFDVVEVVGGKHALRMELCVESLAGRVRREGPLPSESVAALGAALSRALAAAHRLGVLHGGLSPTNVLFRVTGEAVLADFGVAQRQRFRRDPLHGIEWVPPETLRTGVVDARTDLYGLGAVLHFALTGESPHPSRVGELTDERVLRMLSDPVPAISRPDVPIALATTIGRLLAPDPAKRSAPWSADASEALSAGRPGVWPWSAAVAVMLAAVLVVVFWPHATPESLSAQETVRSGSETVPSAPEAVPSATVPSALIELAEPVDLVDQVTLSWTATDDRLSFAVVFWADGEKSKTTLVGFNRTKTLPVEPGKKYCFMVRGTTHEGRIVHSAPRALREANCER
jgi:serine/threonine protein kinase